MRIVLLFLKLTALVAVASWVTPLLFYAVYNLSPQHYDFSDHIVTAGMAIVVALAGWVIASKELKA